MRRRRVWLVLFALAASGPAPAAAQKVASAVAPDTVRVGDIFQAAIQVDLPPGHRAEFPDSLPVAGDVEQAGWRGERVESQPDGSVRLTVVYPLSAWRPGEMALPAVPVRVTGPDGERTVEARLPGVIVRSVLPSDTAGIEPRGPKDVLGPSRTWWPLLFALLAGLATAGGVMYWRRQARVVPLPAPVPPAPPRERALGELDRIRALGLLEEGSVKQFYTLVSGVLRGYLEAVGRGWGAEQTTSELLARVEGVLPEDAVATLARALHEADLVKFAQHRPGPADAEAYWEAVRSWILAHDGGPQEVA